MLRVWQSQAPLRYTSDGRLGRRFRWGFAGVSLCVLLG